ncbi:JAB domain-containing protein [Mixta sp. Marseille-Q2659]|uniref:JAB domain-containing protein n=1 Tax=Mixta sp. Marseille-Q2659 TaxID=2736607 RepID=UPI0023B8E967|nr:JAB domain-containing protein [Mixta sp. Marseille-Q2659]
MSQQSISTGFTESEETALETVGASIRFFSHLHVRDIQGNYVMASVSQILKEAMRAIDFRYPAGTAFASPEVSAEFFRAKLAGREREIFAVAFLNNQHQLIAYEELFMGSIASTEIHPRELVRAALRINAAAVILSHNHPSFSTTVSRADKQITERLKKTLELVAVQVIDHIIVAGNETVSMAERGLI